jgi:hypothetical protein
MLEMRSRDREQIRQLDEALIPRAESLRSHEEYGNAYDRELDQGPIHASSPPDSLGIEVSTHSTGRSGPMPVRVHHLMKAFPDAGLK